MKVRRLFTRFTEKISTLWYNFIRGVKNLLYYFPVIWKDRDYDYYFFFQIMKRKLEKMMPYQSEDIQSRIKICLKIIDNYDGYETEFGDYYDADWDFVPVGNGLYEIGQKNVVDRLDEYFSLHKAKYKRLKNDDRILTAILISYERHRQAKRILFRILEDNIGYMWY